MSTITRQMTGVTADTKIEDRRFRAVLGEEGWASLHPAVQRRFSKRVAGGDTIVYVGEIDYVKRNWAGRFLAQALRVVGAPLPIGDDVNVPSVVSVTEDGATGGQIWTRLYANKTCFPQVIHSSKRFAGPTGLEEYIGYGISMALTTQIDEGALVFESAGYYLSLGRLKIGLPGLLHPGKLVVCHRDHGGDTFEFSMRLDHPLFGELVCQRGRYHEERQ